MTAFAEQRLLAAFNNITEAVIVTDGEHRVTHMNALAEALTEWPLSEARALPLEAVFCTRGEFLVGREGGLRPISATGAPMPGAGGEVVVFRDVTRELEQRAALERSHHELRQIVAKAHHGVIIQRDDRVVFANPALAKMLGYEGADRLIGRLVAELVHTDEVSGLREHSVDARELRLIGAAAQVVHVEVQPAGLIDFEELPSLLLFVHDLTSRRRMEAQVLSTDRMLTVGRLAAGVAHEINSPLAAVIGNLEMIAEDLQRAPLDAARLAEINEMIADSRAASDRVSAIVRDMKLFARVDEERAGPVDVHAVIDSALKMVRNELRHRARVVKQLEPVPPVCANDARLAQVIVNLLMNAAQAIVEGDAEHNEILLATRAEGDRVIVEVRDTGAGIAREHVSRVFDPFFTTKRIGAATGLGLSICHTLVSALGGRIEVESEAGRGSTFRVSLPASQWAPPARKPAPAAAGAARRGRVLVVDDDEAVGRTLRRSLSADHDVTVTTDGRRALELLLGGAEFDTVLCDVLMPEVGGVEVFETLKIERPGAERRIVFLTGGAFTPRTRQFLDSIENPRLEKPFDLATLRELLRARVAPSDGGGR